MKKCILAFACVATAAVACAQGQTFDDGGDAGVCTTTPCEDAGEGFDSGRHDAGTVRDASTALDASPLDATFVDAAADATIFDAGTDATIFDAGTDAAIFDSAVDTGIDSSVVDASFDAGTVCSGTLLSGTARRYGNTTPFASNSTHAPDDLLGGSVTIAQGGTLLGFGVYGRSAGPHLVLSLYTDAGGRPGTLVAQTSTITSCVGTIEPPVTAQTSVAAGTYWIMGVWDATGSIGINLSAGATQVDWIAKPFAQALPSTYPSSSNRYSGQAFNYYVVVQ